MARTKQGGRMPRPKYWTSTQVQPDRYGDPAPEAWSQAGAIGTNTASISPGCGNSAFEDVVRQLPTNARMLLADSLTEGGDVGSGSQANLAAARLSCKTLRRAVDEGLRTLRLNTLPDMPAQGPAPSLSTFPNVTSLTLSVDSQWAAPSAGTGSHHLLPGEQPVPNVLFRSRRYAYPPSLLLGPLQGQPPQSLHRLRSLTLIGQMTCFRSLCEQLENVFAGPCSGTGAGSDACQGGAAASDSSGGDTSDDESDSSEYEYATDDDYDATEVRGTTTSNAAPADSSVAVTACRGGTGAGGAGGGATAWSLEHLNLGNVSFPLSSVAARRITKGHRALAVLGLRELTLGVELLPGLEEHKALQRLRAYFTSEYRFFEWLSWEAALASLRKTPLQHVSLFGHGWCHDKAQAALNTLPNTLAGVSLGYRPSAHLKLGQDETGRDTRELELSPSDTYGADEAVQALSAWPRGLPPSARITLVRLTGPMHAYPNSMTQLSPLLARAEQVEWHAVTVHHSHVAECLPLPHAVPRVVHLNVPHLTARYGNIGLRLAVAGPGTGSGGAGGGGDEPRDGVAAVVSASAPGVLPTPDDVLVRAVEVMEERALADAAPQEQQPALLQAPRGAGVRGHGGRAAAQSIWTAVNDDADAPVERWWRAGKKLEAADEEGGAEAVGMLLLSGPGVLALAAHSTEAGEAALEAALEGLSRSRPGARQLRAYQVLPGGGGVLLQWDEGDVAEAAVEAVRCAAVQLGLEVPEGGVRALALPHRDLDAACEGLYAGVVQVLQSRPLCPEDLVGQLQAVAELWYEVREQWRWPRCAVRPVAIAPKPTAEAEPKVEVEPTAEAEPTAEVPWLTAAATAVGRAAQAAAATAMGLFTVARSGTWRRAAAKRPASAAADPSEQEAAGRQQQRCRTG